jgi:hypothetical protein
MAEKGYKVLVDELTVHKAVRQLSNPVTGEPEGWQQGAGETWFLDEVIPASQMNPEWVEALESGDEDNEMYTHLSRVLEASSHEPVLNEAYRMGLPFEGYDDMDEEDILAAMHVLPSPAVQRIKDWERRGEGRESIVNYNIGFGESPDDRTSGRLTPPESDEVDENKAVRRMRTRELDPETGEFQFGEGITGSGDPPIAPGTTAAQEEAEGQEPSTPPESEATENKLQSARAGGRAGRRPRPKVKADPPQGEPQTTSPAGKGMKPGDSSSTESAT